MSRVMVQLGGAMYKQQAGIVEKFGFAPCSCSRLHSRAASLRRERGREKFVFLRVFYVFVCEIAVIRRSRRRNDKLSWMLPRKSAEVTGDAETELKLT
jgi:hypothetical protein